MNTSLFYRFFICFLIFCGLLSCSDNEIPEQKTFDTNDNSIKSLTLTVNADTFRANIESNTITIDAPYNISFKDAVCNMEYAQGATINPNPAIDKINWARQQVFLVTSYNGKSREYVYLINHKEIHSNGNVTLLSMSDIDAFNTSGVSVITGDLIVGSNEIDAEEITSLKGLCNLKEVKGTIFICNSLKARDFEGLDNLQKIGGLVNGSPDKPSSAMYGYLGLNNLEECLGEISIWNNRVEWINFPKLTRAGAVYLCSMKIQGVNMPILEEVSGDLVFNPNEKIASEYSNCPLPSIELPKLKNVSGTLSANYISYLKDIALPKLENVGAIDFSHLTMKFERLYMPALKSVIGDLSIASNMERSTIGMMFSYNESLKSIGTFNELEHIGGIFTLKNFAKLESIPDLYKLKTCGGIVLESILTAPVLRIPNVAFNQSEQNGICIINCNLTEIECYSPINTSVFVEYFKQNKVPSFTKSTVIDGNYSLYLSDGDPQTKSSVEIKNLVKVNGNLDIKTNLNTPYNIFRFPDLFEVSGYFSAIDYFGRDAQIAELSCPNLNYVGGQFYAGYINELKLGSLEEVCCSENASFKDQNKYSFNVSCSKFFLPKLSLIGGKGVALYNCNSFECPLLHEITGTLLLKNYESSSFDIPSLTTLSGLTMTDCTNFYDFSFFVPFIKSGQIARKNWNVSGCGYNPTYTDMKAGRYKQN